MEPDIGDKGIFSLSRFLKKLKLWESLLGKWHDTQEMWRNKNSHLSSVGM
jgi:hypothetical protein